LMLAMVDGFVPVCIQPGGSTKVPLKSGVSCLCSGNVYR
jgi:hypothetical protein